MEGVEYSAYPCASALAANDKPTIARVALAESGRPNSRADEVMVTSEIGTFETCRPALTMSASRGKSEVMVDVQPMRLTQFGPISLPEE
jgi:hypothetical protein